MQPKPVLEAYSGTSEASVRQTQQAPGLNGFLLPCWFIASPHVCEAEVGDLMDDPVVMLLFVIVPGMQPMPDAQSPLLVCNPLGHGQLEAPGLALEQSPHCRQGRAGHDHKMHCAQLINCKCFEGDAIAPVEYRIPVLGNAMCCGPPERATDMDTL